MGEPAAGDTLTLKGDGASTLSHSASIGFPVPAWALYEPVRLLGQGAMGRVFLARDLRLRREVALKFMRSDDPELAHRFVAEARAQARVDHEHVCKVYEVGEVDGRVYIAMQYLAGRPLGELRGELTVEQIAMLVRGAALGVHEAHRAGLIHRDLKPGNILVARTTDGELQPYVMDFGLARDWNASATMTGTVLGTPRFMAPEQARGEVTRLDRRADVYSLGATLYALLGGQPPIPGDHPLEILANVAVVEPQPLRAIHPDIPRDLEAIAMKCLEKDRSLRYDSARALADDLRRFLAGEPVLARATGAGYRLRKRLRKHAVLTTALAVAFAVMMIAVGYALYERSQVARREELARGFTERVERIEALARYSAMAPLHNALADRAKLRAAMAALERDIAAAGAIARGPGRYALGRGWLALGDDERAERQLRAAWQDRFRMPRVAYALALATGHLYQQGLRAAERLPSAEQRDRRRRELAERYRAPALAYLRDSRGADVPSIEYVEALIAFYDGRHDTALDRLDEIDSPGAAARGSAAEWQRGVVDSPGAAARGSAAEWQRGVVDRGSATGLSWFYEAQVLRGEILQARGADSWRRGELARTSADIDASRRAFVAAAAIGDSDPAVHDALGDLEYSVLTRALYGGGDVEAAFERGLAAISRSLAIDPDRYEALAMRARFQRSMAEYRSSRGEDTTALLTRATADSERALQIAPLRHEARLALAQTWRQRGEARQSRGDDPALELRTALEVADGIAPAHRDSEYYALRGLVFKVWADYDDALGRDARAVRNQAIDAYKAALAYDDQLVDVWLNLGVNYHDRAAQPHNREIDRDIQQAIAAFDRGRALDANNIVAYFYAGRLHLLGAQRRRDTGGDPSSDLALALARYREGLAIDATLPQLHSGIGTALLEQAQHAWDHGGDPFPLIDAAAVAYQTAATVAPALALGDRNLGWALAKRAAYLRARGEDPGPAVRAAEAALGRATERAPNDAYAWSILGYALIQLAESEVDQRIDPRASLAKARAALDRSLAIAPQHALLFDGEAKAVLARWRTVAGAARAEDFAAAAASYERALALAPLDLEARVQYGAFCRAWAAWLAATRRDPSPGVRRGLELVAGVLASRPAWPEALALRAGLRVIQSSSSVEPASDLAASELRAALAANPNLAPVARAWARWEAADGSALDRGGGSRH